MSELLTSSNSPLKSSLFIVPLLLSSWLFILLLEPIKAEKKESLASQEAPIAHELLKNNTGFYLDLNAVNIKNTPKKISIIFGTFGNTFDNISIALEPLQGNTIKNPCIAKETNTFIKDNKELELNFTNQNCTFIGNYRLNIFSANLTEASNFEQKKFSELNQSKLAIWAQPLKSSIQETTKSHILISEEKKLNLIGEIVLYPEEKIYTRGGLLIKLWEISISQFWLGILLSILLFFSFRLILLHSCYDSLSARKISLGVMGILTINSFLTLPLHAPDEPDHLLSVFHLTLDGHDYQTAENNLVIYSANTHFSRVRFSSKERILPSDLKKPLAAEMPFEVSPVDYRTRSPLMFQLSKLLGPRLFKYTKSIPHQIAIIRAFFLLLSGFCIIAVSFALESSFPRNRPSEEKDRYKRVATAIPLSLLCVPALATLNMHVSNYGLLFSGYLLALSGFTILLVSFNDRITFCGMTFLTIGFILASYSGRSGSQTLLLFLTLGFCSSHITKMNWLKFLALTLIPALTIFALLNSDWYIKSEAGTVVQKLIFENLTWKVPDSLLYFFVVFFIFSPIFLKKLFNALREPQKKYKNNIISELLYKNHYFWVLIILILSIIFLPFVVKLESLANNEISNPIRGIKYGTLVTVRFLLGLGSASPDFYVNTSFWSGFGWLDTFLPVTLLYFFKSIPTVFATLNIFAPKTSRNTEKVLCCILTSCTLVFINSVAIAGAANIHGRYLLMAYLLIITPILGIFLAENDESRVLGRVCMVFVRFAIIISVCSSQTLLLWRYFGK